VIYYVEYKHGINQIIPYTYVTLRAVVLLVV